MYEIRPESIKTFIQDRTIKLPRFQRKQTWDAKKNFQLCVSLFKQYPIGVCILSHEKLSDTRSVKFLLDGRQRRNALKQLAEDPEMLYVWARKFLDLKSSDQSYEVVEKYINKINEFLEEDEDKIDTEPKEESIEEEYLFLDDEDPATIIEDGENQVNRLDDKSIESNLLLKIILAIHKKEKRRSGFTAPFDFVGCVEKLPYVKSEGRSYILSSRDLKEFINSYRDYCEVNYESEYNVKEHFISYLQDRFVVTNDKKLKQIVSLKWDSILDKIEILQIIDDVLSNSKIGIIEVMGMKSSDYQKIFSLINSQGAPLKAIEVLSSKPRWNIKLNSPSASTLVAVQELYKAIGIQTEGVVRWDLPATLITRIGQNFVFRKFSSDKTSDLITGITIGFKVASGIYTSGVTKDNIEKLSEASINWEIDIDNLISDIQNMFKIMKGLDYFKYFETWRTSVMELTSDFIAMDFIIMCYLNWQDKGKPMGNGTEVRKFQKDCFIILDRLYYDYVRGIWKSSADSKIRSNIEKLSDGFKAVSKAEWEALLTDIFDNSQVNGVDITLNMMRPLLYHFYCLSSIDAPSAVKYEALEVDHIIPQALFKASATIERSDVIVDNLLNLGVLPKGSNITKKDKKLVQISSEDILVKEIQKYEFIEECDFKKYSDINNYREMFDSRRSIFLEVYGKRREFLLNN